MTLGGHLRELRRRFIISISAILVGTVVGWIVSPYIYAALQAPILNVAKKSGRDAALNFDTVTGSFDLTFQMSLTVGFVLASPVWLWQLWAFITPGLVKNERAYAIGFLASGLPLFAAGCATGWFVMPHIVDLMLDFAPESSISNLSARYYYDFILKLMIAAGIGFVLPVILVMLNFAGVMQGRTILKGWRIAVIVIVAFTAISTPATDILSMLLLALPLVALYFIAVGVALVNDKRRERKLAAFLEAEGISSA